MKIDHFSVPVSMEQSEVGFEEVCKKSKSWVPLLVVKLQKLITWPYELQIRRADSHNSYLRLGWRIGTGQSLVGAHLQKVSFWAIYIIVVEIRKFTQKSQKIPENSVKPGSEKYDIKICVFVKNVYLCVQKW